MCVCVCGGVLLPLWARGKSNKIDLMGVWSLRRPRVGFAGRHWWVVVVVEMGRMELDPLSSWQSSRAQLLLSSADGEPMLGLDCELGGLGLQNTLPGKLQL